MALPSDFLPQTIFIGGGTPSAPDVRFLKEMFARLQSLDCLRDVQEFSCEVNPGTADAEKLAALRAGGVNRLSMGVQSFDPACLSVLGRIHTAEQSVRAYEMARAAGFDNVSLDLIFGVPGQTLAMLDADLDQMIALDPEHVAVYNLMYEEGTPLTQRAPERLDEDLEGDMYDHIRARLNAAGLNQYEISNFSKPGYACQHNKLYWTGGDYVGCGPAAHSHWKGKRWGHASDLDDYLANGPVREFEETLSDEEKSLETLVMSLRMLEGVEVESALFESRRDCLEALEQQGLVKVSGQHVRLTETALFVSDSVFSELL